MMKAINKNQRIKYLCFMLVALFFFSCDHSKIISDETISFLKEELQSTNIYITRGVYAQTDKKKVKYLEVEIINSKFIKNLNERELKVNLSALATVVYRNMPLEFKEKYNVIQFKLVQKSSEKTLKYPLNEILIVNEGLETIKKFNDFYNKGDFENIIQVFNSSIIEKHGDEIPDFLNDLYESSGKIKDWIYVGYEHSESVSKEVSILIEYEFDSMIKYVPFGFKLDEMDSNKINSITL
ncbi:MAG: hypothetical protein MI922_18940 [Bacteroidales bacterium]|nr:hypothetical protein [Bacteroidales bacterium]